MGMFDSFYFKNGALPDNKVDEDYEFQTKSLSCSLDKYYVDEHGNVTKKGFFTDSDEEESKPINECAYVYSHEFLHHNDHDIMNRVYLGCKYQEYKIVIANSKIVHVEKIEEVGYEEPPTDPRELRDYRPNKSPVVTKPDEVLFEINRFLNEVGINRDHRIECLMWRIGMSYGEASDIVGPEKASDY